MVLKSVHMSVSRAAALLLALALVLGSAVAQASPAQAATGDSTSDGNVVVTYLPTTLRSDVNDNGRPDVGDTVFVTYEIAAVPGSGVTEINLWHSQIDTESESIGPWVVQLPYKNVLYMPVRAANLDPLGGGPHYSPVNFTYSLDDVQQPRVNLSEPPLIYTAPTPITVASSVELDGGGALPSGGLVEGDRVRYTATVTNDAEASVTLTSAAGLDPDSTLPLSLAAGVATTLHGAWHTVTFEDMEAGSVQWPATSVNWEAGQAAGAVDAASKSVDTAVIDASFNADVSTAIHNADQTLERALGEVVVGDRIDYTVGFSNTGNVTFGYVWTTRNGLSGWEGYGHFELGLAPGQSLPFGFASASNLTSESNGPEFRPHVVTEADLERGYADLRFDIRGAPTPAWYFAHKADSGILMTKRVFLRELDSDVNWTVDAVLQDTNGDGVGQAGEDVALTWTASLSADAEQSVTIAGVDESGQFSAVGAAFDGVTLAPGEDSTHAEAVTVDAGWLASGALDYTATLRFAGDVDSLDRIAVASTDAVALGEYAAPPVSLTVLDTFDDLNGDGQASIGETVMFDVSVTNDGTYPLTGVTLGEAGGATLAPAVLAVDALAPGASAAWNAEHVVTAADFAAGTLSYTPTVDADGMDTLSETATVTPLTFAAYEADLDGVAEGGIAVCSAAGEPVSRAVQGSTVAVMLGDCDGASLEEGSRTVAFSTPMLLGLGSGPVTIPTALVAGNHRVAVYGADGVLVGWAAIVITEPVVEVVEDPVAGGLSATGAQGIGPMLWVTAALLLAGAGGVFASRRRRSKVDA